MLPLVKDPEFHVYRTVLLLVVCKKAGFESRHIFEYDLNTNVLKKCVQTPIPAGKFGLCGVLKIKKNRCKLFIYSGLILERKTGFEPATLSLGS